MVYIFVRNTASIVFTESSSISCHRCQCWCHSQHQQHNVIASIGVMVALPPLTSWCYCQCCHNSFISTISKSALLPPSQFHCWCWYHDIMVSLSASALQYCRHHQHHSIGVPALLLTLVLLPALALLHHCHCRYPSDVAISIASVHGTVSFLASSSWCWSHGITTSVGIIPLLLVSMCKCHCQQQSHCHCW